MNFQYASQVSALTLTAAFCLSACEKSQEERTVGQQVDSAIAKIEKKSDEAKVEIKKDVNAAEASGTKMMDSTAEKLKDAGITTSINAELARDPGLSALKINVDTTAGRVALRGTAPDAAAVNRATELAKKVAGVMNVDNQLTLRRN